MSCRFTRLVPVIFTNTLVITLLAVFSTNNMLAASAAHHAEKPELLGIYTLPRISMQELAPPHVHYDLVKAHQNGLRFTNLPSIGSGLCRRADGALFGITDRGPNSEIHGHKRIFPLPDFCPVIMQLALTHHAIALKHVIPLTGTQGQPLSGLSNDAREETGYASPQAKQPLPSDPDGVDTESIRCLPHGGFVLSEEYAPSLLVVSPKGRVLTRYTPTSKPLAGAHYPVQPILPDIFTHRRVNRGFESVALSADGRTLYAILQSPMGNKKDPRYAGSRMVRVLRMDFTHPLHARVTGMYLLRTSPYTTYPQATKQDNIKICEAVWLAPKRLLLLEHGRSEAHLRVANLSSASNILSLPAARTLRLENVHTDLAKMGIRLARVKTIFNTHTMPSIDTAKLEGLALLGKDKLALANDNDFGIGQNPNGEPSKIWVLRLPALLRYE